MDLVLTPKLEQFIEHQISTGLYEDANEVVCDALRHMGEKNRWSEVKDFLSPRIKSAESGDVITQSFDSIIDEVR